jgi:hypothetical protein
MGNIIIPAKEYQRIILDIYEIDSLTRQLDSQTRQLPTGQGNPNEILLKKIKTSSLGDYVRDGGFKSGSVNIGWETVKLEQDRGVKFLLDRVDSIETLNTTIGDLVADFSRRHMTPEVDAYRFARYSANAGTSKTVVLTSDNILAEIDLATATLSNKKVPVAGRVLFVNQLLQPILNAALKRLWGNDSAINTNTVIYNGMLIVYVPSDRFYNAIVLQGNSGDAGFVPDSGAKKVNFVMADPKAIWQAVKVNVPKFLSADDPANEIDSHRFNIRIFHDAGVIDYNKDGVYANLGEAA